MNKSKHQAKSKSKTNKGKKDFDPKFAKRQDPRGDAEGRKDSDGKSWNRASMYIPDDKIRNIVGSFSYSTVTGVPTYFECDSDETSVTATTLDGEVMYGSVMEIVAFPYPGTNTSTVVNARGIGALNTACRKLYSAISAENSKTTQYTPESLGIAMLAIGDLVSAISFATRLYGVAFTYNPRNRHIPKQIIKAMGIDADSLLNNLADYRNKLNVLITSANNIRMLKDLEYFNKCWEMYANYFEDSNSAMAQYYVLRPAGFLKYNEVSPTQGELTYSTFDGPESISLMSYPTLLTTIEDMINRLLTSSLMNYVYTDIINYVAKKGGNLLGFSYVGELYSILPIYDATFMNQVHNMTWGYFDLSNYSISEDPASLQIAASSIVRAIGETAYERLGSSGDVMLDMPFNDNPTPDDNIDALAYTTVPWYVHYDESGAEPVLTYGDIAAPDHPIQFVRLWANNNRVYTLNSNYVFNTVEEQRINDSLVKFLESFSIKPQLYIVTTNVDANKVYKRILGSLNYFTLISYKQLKGIFNYSFLGLFDVEVKDIKPF